MREVISRRISHIGDGTQSLGECPDLILLDGGAAHVNTVKPILTENNIDAALFGMVKDDFHKTRALTDGEREISIALETGVYGFIYNLQEEAHRFAVKSSQARKIKTMTRSSLEKIEGIGPAKAKKLLAALSLSEIRAADLERLKRVSGISESDAKRIYDYYHKK